jgi:hypothetical protein
MTGRRHECSKRVIERCCKALSLMSTQKDAAHYAGISVATFCNYAKRGREAAEAAGLSPEDVGEWPDNWRELIDPKALPFAEFLERTSRAQLDAKMRILEGIAEHGFRSDGDWRALAKLIAIRDPEGYAERKQLDHAVSTGSSGPPRIVIEYPKHGDGPVDTEGG